MHKEQKTFAFGLPLPYSELRESKFYIVADIVGVFPVYPEILPAIRFEDKNWFGLTMESGLTSEP